MEGENPVRRVRIGVRHGIVAPVPPHPSPGRLRELCFLVERSVLGFRFQTSVASLEIGLPLRLHGVCVPSIRETLSPVSEFHPCAFRGRRAVREIPMWQTGSRLAGRLATADHTHIIYSSYIINFSPTGPPLRTIRLSGWHSEQANHNDRMPHGQVTRTFGNIISTARLVFSGGRSILSRLAHSYRDKVHL